MVLGSSGSTHGHSSFSLLLHLVEVVDGSEKNVLISHIIVLFVFIIINTELVSRLYSEKIEISR